MHSRRVLTIPHRGSVDACIGGAKRGFLLLKLSVKQE